MRILTGMTPHAAGRRSWMRRLLPVVLTVALTAMLALPMNAAGAGAAKGDVVKLGMIAPITGATTSNPDIGDAFQAAIKAFNKRGGVGVNGLKMEGIVCDSGADANGEVDCARQMVDEGVVATVNDLTFNNPAGVVEVMEAAGIPRIGLVPTDIVRVRVERVVSRSRPASSPPTSVPRSDSRTRGTRPSRSCARTQRPGATFRGFVAPLFTAVGVDIVGDVAVATGATDYAPYVAEIQRTEARRGAPLARRRASPRSSSPRWRS